MPPTAHLPNASEAPAASSAANAGDRTDPERWFAIDVVEDDGDWSAIPEAQVLIEQTARAAASSPALDLRGRMEVCIALSSDAKVSTLNAAYRGKPKPTNVLSFPAAKSKSEPCFLGDVIFAIETLLREADEQGISAGEHLQHLTVHGLLHLLGFDHETPADAERMEDLEVSILAKLGIANPYDAPLEMEDESPHAP